MKARKTERTDRRGIALAMGTFESLGFAFREQKESDYGIDAHAELIESESPTGQVLGIQIKTGKSYLSRRTETDIAFRTDAAHVDYWLNHALPVIICLCDADNQIIYWQSVTRETAVSTGKGYRFQIPVNQILDSASVPRLTDLLTPFVSPDRYTIFQTKDVSHGLAKRYSFRVVVNGTASKAEIASIVSQVTAEGARRRYHRNHLVEGRWGDADAHVVWTFIYPSAEDEARCNHICRSLWINESLDESARPLAIKGENIGGGIFVNWNKNYIDFAQNASTNTSTKEEYLKTIIPLIQELKSLLDILQQNLFLLKEQDITEKFFLQATSEARNRIKSIERSTGLKWAPYECMAMDDRFMEFVCCMSNIALYYSDKGLKQWTAQNRLILSLPQCSSASETLRELEYELKKVR